MNLARILSISVFTLCAALLGACGGGGGDSGINGGSAPSNGTGTGTGAGTGTGTDTGAGNGTGTGTGTGAGNGTGTGTGNGSGTGTGTGNPSSTTAAGFAYIVQAATNAADERSLTFEGGSIEKCRVDAAGALSACVQENVPGLKNPLSIAISGQAAYIINQTAYDPDLGVGNGGQYPVIKCSVDSTTGELNACDGGTIWLETEWAFEIATTGANGYVLKEGQLLLCRNGFNEKCSDVGGAEFASGVIGTDLTFADGRAYVLNTGTSSSPASILSWNVDAPSGTLSGIKTVSDASLTMALDGDTPSGLGIRGAIAYVALRYSNHVLECAYNATANTITGCAASAAVLPALGAGAVQSSIEIRGDYAYVTRSSLTPGANAVIKCAIGSDGKLGSCAAETAPTFATRIEDLKFAGS